MLEVGISKTTSPMRTYEMYSAEFPRHRPRIERSVRAGSSPRDHREDLQLGRSEIDDSAWREASRSTQELPTMLFPDDSSEAR